MAGITDAELDFAYKYPFSDEAKRYVAGLGAEFDASMLEMGRARLEEALTRSRISYSGRVMREVKQKSVVSYLYARMLVSALPGRLALERYAAAEAGRSGEALQSEPEQGMMKVAAELSMSLRYDKEFSIPFADFLRLAPRVPEYALGRQELSDGIVYLQRYRAARLIEAAIRSAVSKGLPIPAKELPREVGVAAATIKVPVPKAAAGIPTASYGWIAKLLGNPIADVRHRAVNLIFAPYLVNVRGMSEDEATKAIMEYIERCKQVDPNTRINEVYVRYQCRYAKARGSRPLSHDRAAELLKEVASF